jgi:hypothetical protein
MKNRILIFLIMMVLTSFSSTNSEPQSDIGRLHWMLGNWKSKIGSMIIEEKWVLSGDTMMLGSSRSLVNNVLKSSETVAIKMVKDSLFYEVTVYNQNDGKPVLFKMVNINDTLVRFENKKHDFPTQIEYIKLSDSTCLAEISGEIDGEERSIKFNYKRSN